VVRTTLEQQIHFEVCADVADGAKAVEQAQKLKPDVVVLNISMPIMGGFDAAREIKTILPETAIVILSSNADKRFVQEARTIGARAYVTKTAGQELVRAIEPVMTGGDFLLIE
jgi:DNA-binding NarL/FixJ family response regulator